MFEDYLLKAVVTVDGIESCKLYVRQFQVNIIFVLSFYCTPVYCPR